MAGISTTVKVRKFPSSAKLYVTIIETKEFRLRVWIAKRLIRLAAWVMGCRIEVKSEQNAPSEDRQ